MIECYVIGEISTVELLCDYINSYPITNLKGFTFNVPENFSPIFSIKPEIIFLDDAMLESYEPWLARIRQFASIIMVSNSPQKAFDAFENYAFDYLLKPLPYERFIMSINKYNHLGELSRGVKSPSRHKIKDSFFIKADSKGLKEIRVKCDKLLYIEALQNYVILHMEDGINYTCYNTMKEMEDSLPELEFSRVHKSFIINDDKIVSIEGNTIALYGMDKPKILIGNAYKKAFLEKKNRSMIKKDKQTIQLLRPPKIALSLSFFYLIIFELIENGLLETFAGI